MCILQELAPDTLWVVLDGAAVLIAQDVKPPCSADPRDRLDRREPDCYSEFNYGQ